MTKHDESLIDVDVKVLQQIFRRLQESEDQVHHLRRSNLEQRKQFEGIQNQARWFLKNVQCKYSWWLQNVRDEAQEQKERDSKALHELRAEIEKLQKQITRDDSNKSPQPKIIQLEKHEALKKLYEDENDRLKRLIEHLQTQVSNLEKELKEALRKTDELEKNNRRNEGIGPTDGEHPKCEQHGLNEKCAKCIASISRKNKCGTGTTKNTEEMSMSPMAGSHFGGSISELVGSESTENKNGTELNDNDEISDDSLEVEEAEDFLKNENANLNGNNDSGGENKDQKCDSKIKCSRSPDHRKKKRVSFKEDLNKCFETYTAEEYKRKNELWNMQSSTAEVEMEKVKKDMDIFIADIEKDRRGFGLVVSQYKPFEVMDIDRVQLYVKAVGDGSPAQKKGLRPGDLILSVNDRNVFAVASIEAKFIMKSATPKSQFVIGRLKSDLDEY